jgi:hypothetical protein
MANNRMWFVNVRTKQKVLIAKYYPTDGWRVLHNPDLAALIDEALIAAGDSAPVTLYGDNDWKIEYEVGISDGNQEA